MQWHSQDSGHTMSTPTLLVFAQSTEVSWGRLPGEFLNFETSQVCSEAIFGQYCLSTALGFSSSDMWMEYPSTNNGKLGKQTTTLAGGCQHTPWSEAVTFDLNSQNFALFHPGTQIIHLSQSTKVLPII